LLCALVQVGLLFILFVGCPETTAYDEEWEYSGQSSWHEGENVTLPQCLSSGPTFPPPQDAGIVLPRVRPLQIAAAGGNSSAPRRFSRVRCVGNMQDVSHLEDRACLFSDLCYDPLAQDFVFFTPAAQVPVIFDNRRGAQFSFRRRGGGEDEDFLFLTYHLHRIRERLLWKAGMTTELGKPASFSPLTRDGPIPQSAVRLPGVHVLSTAHRDQLNLGHLVWEDAFPMFVSMASLGVYSPCVSIIRTHGCEVYPHRSSERRLCEKFAEGFLRPLTGTCGGGISTLASFAAKARSEGLVCLDTLVAGGTYGAFDEARYMVGRGHLVPLFRTVVLAWHGVDPSARPSSHQILLYRKMGRRGILNFDEVASSVASAFGHEARVCETSYVGLTLAEQLAMLSRTTIAVSPCGGASLILPFLPEGAYAILVNYMEPKTLFRRGTHGECYGCSWTMESEFWDHVAGVNKMYYQVFRDSDFEDGKPSRHAAVRIWTPRLVKLIRAAMFDQTY